MKKPVQKNASRRQQILAGAAAGAVALGLVFLWLKKEPDAPRPAKVQESPGLPLTQDVAAAPEAAPALVPVQGPQSPKDPDANPYKLILEANPELKESEYLKSVVLEGSDAKERKARFFSDPEGIKKAFDKLSDARADSFGNWTPLERVFWVDWVKQAAKMEENPQRPLIKERLFQSILNYPENFKALSEENRKSIVADKIELYYVALRYFSPQEIEQLNAQMKDERLLKLVKYARQNVERLSQMDMHQ